MIREEVLEDVITLLKNPLPVHRTKEELLVRVILYLTGDKNETLKILKECRPKMTSHLSFDKTNSILKGYYDE
jgi:hypothetical protein